METPPDGTLAAAEAAVSDGALVVRSADAEPSRSRIERVLEPAAMAILALATIMTAWSGYQAARWSGVQASSYSQAAARRVDATRAGTAAGQLALYDSTVFSQWATAYATGNTQLQAFERRRFRPEFEVAFDAWLATNPFVDAAAPSSPLVMPAYQVELAQQASDLEGQASALFDHGVEANQRADNYVLVTVFLAVALFLAGMASHIGRRGSEITMLVLSGAALAYSLFTLATYPVY